MVDERRGVPEEGGGHLGGLVVAAHAVGQTGVGITRHVTLGQVRDLLQEGANLDGTCTQAQDEDEDEEEVGVVRKRPDETSG
jgi:hypothetical protein